MNACTRKVVLLDPFAAKLNRQEELLVEIEDKPVYTRAMYIVYKHSGKYLTTKYGFIIAKTKEVPMGLIERLMLGVEPSGTAKWRYRSAMKAYSDGRKLQKELVQRLTGQG